MDLDPCPGMWSGHENGKSSLLCVQCTYVFTVQLKPQANLRGNISGWGSESVSVSVYANELYIKQIIEHLSAYNEQISLHQNQ